VGLRVSLTDRISVLGVFAAVALCSISARASTAADTPAQPPADGLWEWVDRLDGELPSAQVVEVLKERSDEQFAELSLVDDLLKLEVPVDVYADPLAVLGVEQQRTAGLDPNEFDIPIVMNDDVKKWMDYFQGRGRAYFGKWLGRSARYRPMIFEELERRGLPKDLIYLAMIESGFSDHAYSSAGASGVWQFIPSTGRLYHLRVDWWIDDRRDPQLATVAAAQYLSELHKMFGDWYLAFAAYNGGPGRVRRAINKTGSRDFWTLAKSSYIYSETKNYVPKLVAAAIIAKHPEDYGFTKIAYQDRLVYDVVDVKGSVDLVVLARAAGVSLDEFRRFNPGLRRWATPPEGYTVRVPYGHAGHFRTAMRNVPVNKRVSFARHKVQRGETLSKIASNYGVGLEDLVSMNRLHNANQIFEGMQLVIPVSGAAGRLADLTGARVTDASVSRTHSPRPSVYKVKRGDTLSGIAARYGLTVSQLRGWNQLRSSAIYANQELDLRGPMDVTVRYTVRRGDSLSRIANRFGVGLAPLQRLNGLNNPSALQVGRVLKIKLLAEKWRTVTVRPGDSVGALARSHGCRVEDLTVWNGLNSSVIHPGQKLRIRK